jgi:hypothetical protein
MSPPCCWSGRTPRWCLSSSPVRTSAVVGDAADPRGIEPRVAVVEHERARVVDRAVGGIDAAERDEDADPMLDLDERTGREVGAAPRSGREPGPVQVRATDRHGVRTRCCGTSGSTGCARARLVERPRVVRRIARRRAPVGSPENDISPAGVVGVAVGDVVLDRVGRAAVELGGHRVREAERLSNGLDAHLLGRGYPDDRVQGVALEALARSGWVGVAVDTPHLGALVTETQLDQVVCRSGRRDDRAD